MTEIDFFVLADQVISKAYPGKPGWWGKKRIPNYGILRGAIEAELRKIKEQLRCPGDDKCDHLYGAAWSCSGCLRIRSGLTDLFKPKKQSSSKKARRLPRGIGMGGESW